MRNILLITLLFITLCACSQTSEKEYLLGRFEPSNDSNFVLIEKSKSNGEMYVRKETYNAFVKMYNAALKDGIKLTVVSATRNFNRQKAIWTRKWNNLNLPDKERINDIMQYSSMPGTSRHHWGTDIDLISVENDYWQTESGKKALKWLNENASKYGFFRPYSDDPNRTGYQPEEWHWSYAPLSGPMLERYLQLIKPQDINGFYGSQYVEEMEIIRLYVEGIDKG